MVTWTLLVDVLLFDILPKPSVFLISFTSSSSNPFLLVIIVLEMVDVFPVLDTLYPAVFNVSTAFSSFALLPLPFNTSIFMSALLFV